MNRHQAIASWRANILSQFATLRDSLETAAVADDARLAARTLLRILAVAAEHRPEIIEMIAEMENSERLGRPMPSSVFDDIHPLDVQYPMAVSA